MTNELSMQVKEVPPHLLKPHPINEKIYGKEPVDQSLKESIRKGGILEEIQVTPEYVIISGHRRHAVAMDIGLETVPVRLRYDIEGEDAIVWALIESNRTQREKTTEQKIREIYELNERIKTFRLVVSNKYGKKTLKEIAEMEIADSLQSGCGNDIQEFIAENVGDDQSNSSLNIPLKKYGMSLLFYKKARKAMIAIEEFEDKGKIREAAEIRKVLNSRGMKAFDKVVDRLRGTVVKKNFKSPSVLMSRSIETFTDAIVHLKEGSEHAKRANLALGMMKSIREELVRMSAERELGPATEKILHDQKSND